MQSKKKFSSFFLRVRFVTNKIIILIWKLRWNGWVGKTVRRAHKWQKTKKPKQQPINISSLVRLRPLYRICACLSVRGEQEEGASDVSHAWDEQPGQKTKRTPEHSLALLLHMRDTDNQYMVGRCVFYVCPHRKTHPIHSQFNFGTFFFFSPTMSCV